MKKQTFKKAIALAALSILFVFAAVLTNGAVQTLAAPAAQETIIVPTVAVTAIIPGTGSDAPPAMWSSWIFWVIVGAILLAVVLALIARAATPVDHTHHPDDHL
jgi:hypothetical protein